MLIHAYRRSAPIEVSLFGSTIEFVANEAGAVVAEVDDEKSVERLLSIDDAYRAYGEKVATVAAVTKEPSEEGDADSLVLTNDAGETLDISKWTAKQVRVFATENAIELPAGNGTPVAELRTLLAKALKAE